MAKLGDFLTKRQKDELYESLTRHVLNLPNVKPNSWDAFFIIIFLILVADKKIRPAEQAFFDDLINSIFDNNWDSSHLIRGKIPKKGRQINLANKVLSIYEDIRSLDEDALMEVVKSLAANISDKDLRVISLLCISRLAISDLELAKYERKLIFMFAEAWEMENLLIEIKFTKLREETEANFVKTLLNDHSDLIDRNIQKTVKMISNQNGILGGIEFAKETFKLIDKKIKFKNKKKDGSRIRKDQVVATIDGDLKNILTGERVALNFVSHISGIATKTNMFVKKVGKKTKICCTRKTIPNLRVIQKYAVKLGGGANHRERGRQHRERLGYRHQQAGNQDHRTGG